MASYRKLAPPEFRKIAQNDDQHGNVLAVVFHCALTKRFFIQLQSLGEEDFQIIGPISSHVFEQLMQVMNDIKDMDKRYMPLE